MAAAESSGEPSVLERVLELITRVIPAPVMADPSIVGMDVRIVGMRGLVPKIGIGSARPRGRGAGARLRRTGPLTRRCGNWSRAARGNVSPADSGAGLATLTAPFLC